MSEDLPSADVSVDSPVKALILAAGRSQRMGAANKLLMPIGGRPMVCHVAAAVRDAGIDEVIVVTGHQRRKIESVLAGADVSFVHNRDYARGLSSSVIAGIKAAGDARAVLICLGDMPRVTAHDIVRLISSCDPARGRAICVPTFAGRRGNPVLWTRQVFGDLLRLRGDVGAKRLLSAHADLVHEVPMTGPGVLIDIDTEQAFTALGSDGAATANGSAARSARKTCANGTSMRPPAADE